MVRNCSWPAVSQIWSFCTFLAAEMHGLDLKINTDRRDERRGEGVVGVPNSRLVLPTALSPIMSILIGRMAAASAWPSCVD